MIASSLAAMYPDQFSRFVIMAGSVGGPTSQPWSPDTAAKIAAVPAGDYQRFMLWLFPDGIKDNGFCSLAAAYNSWKPYSEGFFNKQWLAEQSRAINKFWKDNSTVKGIQKVRWCWGARLGRLLCLRHACPTCMSICMLGSSTPRRC